MHIYAEKNIATELYALLIFYYTNLVDSAYHFQYGQDQPGEQGRHQLCQEK